MEWITIWLKKVILLVLLAAFLDLVLPNTSLQRYVKMVMGLIILLAVLSPAFALFNLSPEELAQRISQYQIRVDGTEDGQWRQLSNKLLDHQKEQMDQYVTSQLEALISQQVAEEYQLELAKVSISLERNEQNQEQSAIREMILTVADQSPPGSALIRPIEPVEIDSGLQASEKVIPAVGRNQPALYRQIANHIAQQWNIRPDQVKVVDENQR